MEEETFTKEELERIKRYKAQLSLDSPESISLFGTALQQKMADLSDQMLKNSTKKDLEEVSELLQQINDEISSLNKKKSGFSLFRKKEKRPSYITNLDETENKLKMAQAKFLKDIALIDQFEKINEENRHELSLLIRAGDEIMAYEAAKPDKKKSGYINQFEKKLNDLKVTHTVSMQNAEQFRIQKENELAVADKIRSCVVNTIPLIRSIQGQC